MAAVSRDVASAGFRDGVRARVAGEPADGGLTLVGPDADGVMRVDGAAMPVAFRRYDEAHALLVESGRTVQVLLGPARRRPRDGMVVRVVVVNGWRFEVEIEAASRAALRARASRDPRTMAAAGRMEVRAIIPGRVVEVSAAPGDRVVAGDQLAVLEAMKMQNELRSPRDGTVERVLAVVGENVEVGDLLFIVS